MVALAPRSKYNKIQIQNTRYTCDTICSVRMNHFIVCCSVVCSEYCHCGARDTSEVCGEIAFLAGLLCAFRRLFQPRRRSTLWMDVRVAHSRNRAAAGATLDERAEDPASLCGERSREVRDGSASRHRIGIDGRCFSDHRVNICSCLCVSFLRL